MLDTRTIVENSLIKMTEKNVGMVRDAIRLAVNGTLLNQSMRRKWKTDELTLLSNKVEMLKEEFYQKYKMDYFAIAATDFNGTERN